MNRPTLLCVASVGLAASALAGCGSSGSSDSTPSTAGTKPAPRSAAPTVDAKKTSLGTVVVDDTGRTLYVFAKDTGPKSTCSGACASNWPPFTAQSAPRAGTGVAASALSLVKRDDGRRQVVLDGHPLYFFGGDRSAGQANGQGVDAFGAKWFVVSPSGRSVTGSGSAGGSSGYGGNGY
jgi:predicted lipoprotein with Yx(FWY)xxD motif